MKYEFYVEDEGDWYGVLLEGGSYICVQQDVAQPFVTVLNEQTIEHHNRMVANYRQRQDALRKKIKELEGV